MEVLHITAIAEEGKIIINVPESFNGKAVDVTVTEKDEEAARIKRMTREEKLEWLKQFADSAKYPDTPIDKYEWYEQAGDY